VAVEAIVNVAVIEVSLTTANCEALIPAGVLRAVAPVRLRPVSVTGTLVPCTPEAGAMVVSVGSGGALMVNVALAVPPAVVTVTV